MGGKNEPGCVKQDLNGTLGTFSNPTVCQEAFHKLICQTDELSSVHGRLLLGLKTVSGPCKAELFLIGLKVLFVCLPWAEAQNCIALGAVDLPQWYDPGLAHRLHEQSTY